MMKKESEKKHLKEKGALRRAYRKRTTKKNSMDEGLNKKAENAPRTEEESKLRAKQNRTTKKRTQRARL